MNSGYLKCAGISPRRMLYMALLAVLPSASLAALPEGGQVVAGEAEIELSDQHMDVHQASQRVIIDYQSFNVGADQRVTFVQPNAEAVALNRVLGNDLSAIDGQISANGQVFLINPNGVLFGQGSEINVGALVTSTLDIENDDFMAGREHFAGQAQGNITNHGSIHASQRAVLMAPEVINTGQIQVPGGDVHLYSGRQVLVQPPGSSIALLVDESDLVGRIDNQGEIHAGRVSMVMDAQSERSLYSSVINNSGLVRATAASGVGGNIELLAPQGDVVNTGALEAQAQVSGAGGTVSVQAQRYGQIGAITVAGSGHGDGGQIQVNTTDTIVLHPGSSVDANAGERGRGGDVIFYSALDTWYREQAKISARGGSTSGDGGFVEVSGRDFIDVQGVVDVGATQGAAGLWYIDPTNIEIAQTGDSGGSMGDLNGDGIFTWNLNTPAPLNSQISINAIRTSLVNGDVWIDTASDAAEQGDISFNAQFEYSGIPLGRTLTLMADRDINFQGSSSIYDASPGTEGLNVVLDAGRHIQFNNTSVVDVRTGTFSATAVGNIRVTDIASVNESETAIALESLTGQLLGDNDASTGLHAENGGVLLVSAMGMGDADAPLNLNTAQLGISNTVSGDIVLDNAYSGDLILTSLGVSGADNLSITAGGSITYTGSQGSDLSNADGAQITLNASTFIAMNGDLGDSADEYTAHFSANAPTGFSMAEGVRLHMGDGQIDVQVGNGDAVISELSSLSSADDAIRVQIVEGGFTGLGTDPHLRAPSGGAWLDIGAGNLNVTTEVARIDATVGGGDIVLQAVNDLEILNLAGAEAIELSVDGELLFSNSANLTANRLTATAEQIILPDAGLGVSDALSLTSPDITDVANSRTLALAASELSLDTTAAGGDLTINTTADSLNFRHGGSNTVTVVNTGGLDLLDVQPVSGTSIISTLGGEDLVITQDLDLQGASGALQLISGNDLTINVDVLDSSGALDSGIDISLQAANNIVFADGAQVHAGTGALSLQAETGAIALGSVAGNSLTITAANAITNANSSAVNFTGTQVTLSAGAGVGSAANPLQGNVQTLALENIVGDVHYHNQGDLTLDAPTLVGDLHLTLPVTGDLILAQGTPDLEGNVFFNLADGSLWLPDGVWRIDGDMTLWADNIFSDQGNPVLAANHGDLTFSANGSDTLLNTDFDTLSLDVLGSQTVQINDQSDLTVTGVSTGGDLLLSAGLDATLVLLDDNASFGGDLSLSAGNDVQVPEAGLSMDGNLQVQGRNLRAAGDGPVVLGASQMDFSLQADSDALFNLQTEQLALDFNSDQNVVVHTEGPVTLSALSAGGDADINTDGSDLLVSAETLNVAGTTRLNAPANGRILVPDSGLNLTGSLLVTADDLLSSEHSFLLGADHADLRIRNSAEDTVINSNVTSLALDYSGTNAVTVIDEAALILTGLTAGGDARIASTDADLTLLANPNVVGTLNLQTRTSGDLILPEDGLLHDNALVLDVDNLASLENAITLAASDADITLRDGTSPQIWTTHFDTLVTEIAGDGGLQVSNSRALTLVGLNLGGAAEIIVDNANLTLQPGAAQVNGHLALRTLGEGDLVMPETGLHHTGDLLLEARRVHANGDPLSLSGLHAEIIQRANEQNTDLVSALEALTLDSPGVGAVTVVNNGPIDLHSLSTGGDLSVTSTDADLTLTDSTPDVAGQLNLITTGVGALHLPAEGLIHGTLLFLDGADIRAAGDGPIVLRAMEAGITLRNAQPIELNTELQRLALTSIGEGSILLQNSSPLTLTQLTAGGAVDLLSAGDLQFLPGASGVAGQLRLVAQEGNVVLGGQGMSSAGPVHIQALNLVSEGGAGATTLTTPEADLTLTGSEALTLDGSMDRLDISYASTENFTLNASADLQLGRFELPNAQVVSTQVEGTLQVPDLGLAVPGFWSITAADLVDSNREVQLGARDLALHLTAPAGNSVLNVAVERLQARLSGSADLQIQSSAPLTLADLTGTGPAIDLSDGHLALAVANGDLQIDGDIHTTLVTEPDNDSPLVDLSVAAGDVMIGVNQPITLVTQRQTASAPGGALPGLRVRIMDASAADRQIVIGEGTSITVAGGDILLDSRPEGTAESALREIIPRSGAQVSAYNSSDDALTGTVILNGTEVTAQDWQRIGVGRVLTLVDSSSAIEEPPEEPQLPGDALDAIDRVEDDALRPPESGSGSGAQAEAQFNLVFGECNELEQEDLQRCRINASVKAFLSHWLVGGEMPPRTESPR